MRRFAIKYYFSSASLMLCLAFLSSCASFGPTKPNLPYQGPYPAKYYELANKNPLLAKELGKLPEIQDGISNSEVSALEQIVDIYNEIPKECNDAFDKMYQVGIPEVRKYCSPLQALFWLACENQIQDIKKILHNYSLVPLLRSAWKFENEHPVTKKQLSSIIDGTKNQRLKEEYTDYLESLELSKLERAIFFDYKRNSNYFNWQARKIIKEAKKLRIDPRWRQFSIVVERLNAPELIDYYSRKELRWVDYRTIPVIPPRMTVPPEYVFKHKKGNCVAITDFIIHCLHRGGYEAFELQVPCHKYEYHSLCVFEKNGKRYLMDNGSAYPRGIMPYSLKSTFYK